MVNNTLHKTLLTDISLATILIQSNLISSDSFLSFMMCSCNGGVTVKTMYCSSISHYRSSLLL